MDTGRLGRLSVTALAIALVQPAVSVEAHAGHGPTLVAVGAYHFDPGRVTIVAGDYVYWDFRGPDTNHSITADPGQSMTFDSDPGKSPEQVDHPSGSLYAQQFPDAGTFSYHCRVHPVMTGTVVVQAPPGGSPSSGSGSGPPTRPVLSGVSARPRRLSARRALRTLVVFSVDRAVSMRATVRRMTRRRAGAVLREVDFLGVLGVNRQRLRLGRLRAGRYRIDLRAVDNANGLTSPSVSFSVEVRR